MRRRRAGRGETPRRRGRRQRRRPGTAIAPCRRYLPAGKQQPQLSTGGTIMMSVSTYSIYIADGPSLLGDIDNATIQVNQSGAAVIDITAIEDLSFVPPYLSMTLGSVQPSWFGWGLVDPDSSGPITEIAINDANGAVGAVSFQLHLAGLDDPLLVTLVNTASAQ
jgi:hypothetical protein